MGMEYKKIIEKLDEIRETSTDLHGESLDALQEAADIIQDYEAATNTLARMQKKYEQPVNAINRGMGYWQCPQCMKRITERHSHCHWCGQAIAWMERSKRR